MPLWLVGIGQLIGKPLTLSSADLLSLSLHQRIHGMRLKTPCNLALLPIGFVPFACHQLPSPPSPFDVSTVWICASDLQRFHHRLFTHVGQHWP